MLHFNKLYGPQILNFFLYLNDVEDGSGTRFNYLCFMAKPKRGTALVWPSLTGDPKQLEDWTWHKVLPVSKVGTFNVSSRSTCL
mmetsp:Transcript_16723/g.36275  ORF Transcript_16723/g.36275 Transcript_16723/m.36275 type:complete len:84 (+) Transcript_16723:571-822(+)